MKSFAITGLATGISAIVTGIVVVVFSWIALCHHRES